MKILYILPVLFFFTLSASAQNEEDALKFSRILPFGSARVTAMGGAFTALGGDLTTLSMNPGGIGVFRKSEFSFTPMLDFAHSKTKGIDNEKNMFILSNAGLVLSFSPNSKTLKNFNVGFNYSTLNNFNRNTFQGYYETNGNSSLANVWKEEADGKSPKQLNDFTTGLAYDAYMLYLSPQAIEDKDYDYENPIRGTDQLQHYKYTRERGYQGEYAISFGGNLSDKFYFGATLGIQSLHYKSFSVYTEEIIGDEVVNKLEKFSMYQDFTSSGTGLNFKAGFIYRPIPALRFGAAIHTPTYYNVDAYANNNVSAKFSELPVPEAKPTPGFQYGNSAWTEYSYKLKTPWRVMAGVAAVLGQRAIISADYEYVDYTAAKFTDDDAKNEYMETNNVIKNIYKSTHNFRAGAEFRFNSVFCIRGGYALSASPYAKGEMNEKNDIQIYSGGMGVNLGAFYADASFMHKKSDIKGLFYYYESANGVIESPEFKTDFKNNEFRLTLGVRF